MVSSRGLGDVYKRQVNVNAKTDTDPEMNTAVIGEVMGGDTEAFPAPQEAPQQTPDQPDLQLTPDQNQEGQTASMPGSGAPAVSPQGAINMDNQQRGL